MNHVRCSSRVLGFLILAISSLTAVAHAQSVDVSNIIGDGDAATLSSELGQGPLALTRIFSHVIGDGKTFEDFHSAADGQGPTFSVFEITSIENFTGTYIPLALPYVVVGYDPQSWDSASGFHRTFADSDRTGFLSNLTLGLVLRQTPDNGQGVNDFGSYQTFNNATYGPSFGGGFDFGFQPADSPSFVDAVAFPLSYGTPTTTNTPSEGILGLGFATHATVSDTEIFTFTENASPTPEPGSLALFVSCGVAGIGIATRRRLTCKYRVGQ